MLEWWQHLPSKMDPVIFSIGSFQLKYYGMMYVLAAILTYLLANYRIKKEEKYSGYTRDDIENIVFYGILGVMLGGRLGYVIFYNFGYYLSNPVEIFWPFRDGQFTGLSGMSYHGGLIGVIVATFLYCRNHKKNVWHLADLFGPVFPLGYTFGRLGNFINGELYGRTTQSSVGMYFPDALTELRHPSQLYEAIFEGLVLFAILWIFRKRLIKPQGAMLAYYIFGYGLVRFFIEYFREPDKHLGFVWLEFSMGQMLCIGMMAFAGLLYFYLWRRHAQLTDEELMNMVPQTENAATNKKWKKSKRKK